MSKEDTSNLLSLLDQSELEIMRRVLRRGANSPREAWLIEIPPGTFKLVTEQVRAIIPDVVVLTKQYIENEAEKGKSVSMQQLLGGQTGLVNPHHVVLILESGHLDQMLNPKNNLVYWFTEDAVHRLSGHFNL